MNLQMGMISSPLSRHSLAFPLNRRHLGPAENVGKSWWIKENLSRCEFMRNVKKMYEAS